MKKKKLKLKKKKKKEIGNLNFWNLNCKSFGKLSPDCCH